MTLPNTWVTGQTFTAADADNVANAVNAATAAAAAAYTKPGPGIPKTDLAAAVQTSLGLADTALQSGAVVVNSLGSLGSTYTLTSGNATGVAFGTLTANTVITLPTPVAGGQFTLVLKQDATGGRTPTFGGATVNYPAGTPNWVITANAFNVLEFLAWDTGAWYVFPSTSGTNDILGNAATATKLLTARNINGVAFDGTANIAVGTVTPTASTLAQWDANVNLSGNNFIEGFASTATAAGTTTLTVTSAAIQVFTGTTTQTVKLPTTSVVAGQVYRIVNNSTGAVTVQSSGANTVLILAANTAGLFTAVVATPTAAADWVGRYWATIPASGKSLTINNSLTVAGTDGTTMTFPSSSDTVATLAATQALTQKDLTGAGNTFPTFNQNTTGSAAKLTTARTINGVAFDGTANITAPTPGQWGPSHHGLIAWAFDPAMIASQIVGTSGTVTVVGLQVPAGTITNVILSVSVAGATLTSGQCFAGLYQGGTLLAATADQSASWNSIGIKTMALTTPQTVTAGLVYVAYFSNGTTNPSIHRGTSSFGVANVGLAAAASRYANADTGRTTSLAASLGTLTVNGSAIWAAVS